MTTNGLKPLQLHVTLVSLLLTTSLITQECHQIITFHLLSELPEVCFSLLLLGLERVVRDILKLQ